MKCRNHRHGCRYKERLCILIVAKAGIDNVPSIELEKNLSTHDEDCNAISVERRESTNHGLTETQKHIIDACGFSAPKAISNFFRTHHASIPEPTIAQITNYKSYKISKTFGGRHQVTVAQLVEFCNELSREVLSADAAFNQDTSYLISDIIEDSDELDFVIVITTDRLIKLAPAKANVHADDTHKVVVENLPFNVAGWNDKSRTFHPSVGGLCSHVDHVRYARLFKI